MKISDVADIINVSEKDPANSGIDIFVGLEHYDIAEPVIKRFGSTKMLSTAAKKFEAGDVLIARRNVYLQRASLVNFSGLTSGDSIILRVKRDLSIEETDYQTMCQLLPFVLNSINFWDYANTNADGTMSKRLSPAMLQEYEFDLPPLAEQKVLAEKLWAAYEVKQSYLKMIAATEEMVKSQFIEMFGDISINSKAWPVEKLANVANIKIGPFGSLIHQRDYQEGSHCLINPSQIINNKIVPDSKVAVTECKYQELLSYSVSIGDIILGRRGEMGRAGIIEEEGMLCGTGSMVIRPKDNGDSLFLHLFITSPHSKEWLENNSVGTTMMNLNTQIVGNMEIPILPANLKQQFVAIANQADKSVFELRKSIDAIDKVIKSLINENL